MFFWHDPKEPKALAPDRLALLILWAIQKLSSKLFHIEI